MLFAPPPEFGFSVYSHSTTRPVLAFGTMITSSASVDTYGSYTEILSDTLITEDCYGIGIWICAGDAAATNTAGTVTIGKDEAGGTSYSDWLTDLICGGASGLAPAALGGVYYYFPMYIKAGTALAAKHACATGSHNIRVGMQVVGRPLYPGGIRAATKFQSFGASAANGTAITPGNATEGSWTQLGSNPSTPLWWWQQGVQVDSNAANAVTSFIDLAIGDASNKQLIFENQWQYTDANEAGYQGQVCRKYPCMEATVNDLIYARMHASGAPNSNTQIAAYGCG